MVDVEVEVKERSKAREFLKNRKNPALFVNLSVFLVVFVFKVIKLALLVGAFSVISYVFYESFDGYRMAAFLLGAYVASDATEFFIQLKDKFYIALGSDDDKA